MKVFPLKIRESIKLWKYQMGCVQLIKETLTYGSPRL